MIETAAPTDVRPITGKQWLTACEQARQELATQPFPRGLVGLRHWPDLAEVPDQLVGPVVRICALLWSKPTASFLVARSIHGEPRQIAVLLRVLQIFGHVDLLAISRQAALVRGPTGGATAQASSSRYPRASFLGSRWRRLLG